MLGKFLGNRNQARVDGKAESRLYWRMVCHLLSCTT